MLQKLNFKPGFDKQITDSGAESQWVDGDFVRFRYGLPEKIGGWSQLTTSNNTLPGAARAQHDFTSLAGEKYVAIGTSQGLFLYYNEEFYDISPLDDDVITGCTFTVTSGSPTVTVNKTSHGLLDGRYITFTAVTVPTSSGYAIADFQDNTFEVLNKTNNTFQITMPTNSAGASSATGSATVNPYEIVGPTFQTAGLGWGTSTWGSSTWGTASATSGVTLDAGLWSLDNFGQILIATIHNGKTFTWNAGAVSARSNRAAVMASAPTKSKLTQVSDRDRHVFHFGTETTVGNSTTQNPMFIRFSDQENFNSYQPTATNTAGTFRLDKGNEIMGAVSGKDYTLVLTDLAAYVIQYVGSTIYFFYKTSWY
jgi:hypothetical protein